MANVHLPGVKISKAHVTVHNYCICLRSVVMGGQRRGEPSTCIDIIVNQIMPLFLLNPFLCAARWILVAANGLFCPYSDKWQAFRSFLSSVKIILINLRSVVSS